MAREPASLSPLEIRYRLVQPRELQRIAEEHGVVEVVSSGAARSHFSVPITRQGAQSGSAE
jgi:hypothetical protein